ncbi:MAG: pilus assembly protein [Paucimonas sp.]|jgi:type IV pilus assembly protein PilX|nr:pilus assembly protein [Paucimonas sp.]
MATNEQHSPCKARQHGAVLVLTMVLLVLLGILGLLAMQASTQQTRMASNLLASLQAFESAEHVLRAAEARLPGTTAPGWHPLGAGRYQIENLGQTAQAVRMPEKLPVTLLRITAIAEERQARVVLQSVVAWPLAPEHGPARRILWRQLSEQS